MRMKKAVSLMEILVVLIIIGILAAIALPNFRPTQERVLDKEAIAHLKLIQAAERIYFIENTFYYPNSGSITDLATINQDLRLALPTDAERHWNYTVWNTGCSRTTRTADDNRSWYLNATSTDEPLSGTGCP